MGQRTGFRITFAATLAAVGLAGLLAVASDDSSAVTTAFPKCGVARWDVKTLSDPAADKVTYKPRATTIQTLRGKEPTVNISLLTPRLKGTVEMRVWRLRNVRLVEAVRAADKDIHLVIRDGGGRKMIVEFPDPDCSGAALSKKRAVMKRAKAALLAACGYIPTKFVDLQGRATIEGVGFFDEVHQQIGVAPNGVELHPVLKFSSGNCSRA
jgi:hypothetical protein